MYNQGVKTGHSKIVLKGDITCVTHLAKYECFQENNPTKTPLAKNNKFVPILPFPSLQVGLT